MNPLTPPSRRQLIGLGLAGLAASLPGLAAATDGQAHAGHGGHGSHGGDSGRDAAPAGRYRGLIKSYQACTSAISACIAHCQVLLAQGDKSVGDCLRTALDCDVTCGATLKAAGLNSAYTPALARTAVQSMPAGVEASKPHHEHHPECKACHDACLAAIRASKRA